jgi:hypothetical protein
MSAAEGTVVAMKDAVTEKDKVEAWRMLVVVRKDVPSEIASRVAVEQSIDLHEFVSYLDKGCAPELAYEILAPL